jgi:hypothetical protein
MGTPQNSLPLPRTRRADRFAGRNPAAGFFKEKAMTLTNWKAKRAGGRITITGLDPQGHERKIVGVDLIEGTAKSGGQTSNKITATDKDGKVHILV